MSRILCSLVLGVFAVMIQTIPAAAHEAYAPGAFLRLEAGGLLPTQDFSNDYDPGFSGSLGVGFFVNPSLRVEGDFLYSLTIDPSDESSAPGDLVVLAGEGRVGYEFTAGSDATPYLEILGGYYSFGIEDSEGLTDRYGAFGVGVGVGMAAYPEFFSGSVDLALRYRYVFANEEEGDAAAFLEQGYNCSFLTVSAGITFNF
jgi:hypothetical protein